MMSARNVFLSTRTREILLLLCLGFAFFIFPKNAQAQTRLCEQDPANPNATVTEADQPCTPAGMSGFFRCCPGAIEAANASDRDIPESAIPLCCPNGFSQIVTVTGGHGFCSTLDLASVPKDRWNEKSHCCKKLQVPTNLPPDTTLPIYRFRETVQLIEKVPCAQNVPDPSAELCKGISNAAGAAACTLCSRSGGIYTAVGCIQRVGSQLITNVVGVLFGLLGGIMLIAILYAAFKISTSRGDPKAVAEGKETITSIVSGALVVLLSATLLQFVGINVLSIPGFPPPVAQDVGRGIAQTLGLREELTTIGGTVGTFLNYAIVIGGLIFFVMILWGGFGILTGAGDPKGQESAKKRISAAAIGFAVLFISFWVMQILQIATGAEIFR